MIGHHWSQTESTFSQPGGIGGPDISSAELSGSRFWESVSTTSMCQCVCSKICVWCMFKSFAVERSSSRREAVTTKTHWKNGDPRTCETGLFFSYPKLCGLVLSFQTGTVSNACLRNMQDWARYDCKSLLAGRILVTVRTQNSSNLAETGLVSSSKVP